MRGTMVSGSKTRPAAGSITPMAPGIRSAGKTMRARDPACRIGSIFANYNTNYKPRVEIGLAFATAGSIAEHLPIMRSRFTRPTKRDVLINAGT